MYKNIAYSIVCTVYILYIDNSEIKSLYVISVKGISAYLNYLSASDNTYYFKI